MPCNLKNMRFGRLRAVERTDQKEDGYYVWRCECECGGQAYVNTKRLLRGTVTNCGCIPKTTAQNGSCAEDLTGRCFGEWKVLHRVENRKERVMWACRCSCGTEKNISAHDLKAGKTHSCRNPIHRHLYNRKDLSGQQFGRLTVLYPLEKRDNKGSIYWHCSCECGRFTDTTEDALIQGGCRSCGCLKEEAQKNIPNTLHRIDGTCVELLERRKYRRDNTSGFRGVRKKNNGKYTAGIGFKRKQYNLGTYESYAEAVSARLEAEYLIHDGFLEAYYLWTDIALTDPEWKESHPLIYEVEKEDGQLRVVSNMVELKQKIANDNQMPMRYDASEQLAYTSVYSALRARQYNPLQKEFYYLG